MGKFPQIRAYLRIPLEPLASLPPLCGAEGLPVYSGIGFKLGPRVVDCFGVTVHGVLAFAVFAGKSMVGCCPTASHALLDKAAVALRASPEVSEPHGH